MGDDFSNRQCFTGRSDSAILRERICHAIRDSLLAAGYEEVSTEAEATRSIVVGPAGRWVFVGDTAGSAETADPLAFAALSADLSKALPIIEIQMSDSAAVHIQLYQSGSLVDRYGNAAFPFFRFTTPEELEPFKGKPELWQDFLLAGDSIDQLRAVWVQDWRADEILADSAKLFGWDATLCFFGYTIDVEGIGLKYKESASIEELNLSGFSELYFQK